MSAGEQDAPRAVDAAALDFWSFVDVARRRLAEDFGFPHRLATQVLLTLNRASDVVTYDLEAQVHRPRGRSWSSFRLLFVVWLAGPLEPSAAARLTGSSRAAVSGLVRTLVEDGLLERTPVAGDGRSVRLSLTSAGQAEMLDVFGEHNDRESAWVEVLTEDEQRTLVALLTKLIAGRRRFEVRSRL